ncbi:MAG: SurA N-terminal domain-containing protein [Clostridiales bacterium]|nr:SurA N-terminal domain-containing protein [Clostridiales bacterium]MCF8023660.1 SurA N-terminal domain-containing protein [Clostridiales bacterium]
MKNKSIILLVCVFILSIAATGVYASTTPFEIPRNVPTEKQEPSLEQVTQNGQEIQDLLQSDLGEKPVVKVFDEIITAADIELVRKSAKLHGKQLTKDDVVSYYVLQQAVAAEAKKLGIYPSKSETKEFIENTFEKIRNNNSIYKEVAAELKGRGVSEQEYIESRFDEYRDLLAAYKLKNHIAKEMELAKKDPAKANEIYSNYLDQLVKDAEYKIIDKGYLNN